MQNDFLEKTLEEMVFDNRHKIHLYGLPKFRKNTFRQVLLPSGKKMDIFSFDLRDGHLYFDIYELKRESIGVGTLCQAHGYYNDDKMLKKGTLFFWNPSYLIEDYFTADVGS